MDKYINKEDAIERINRLFTKNHDGSVAKNDYNSGLYAAKAEMVFIAGVDVQPVATTENKATVQDDFVCKKCGVHLRDLTKVEYEEYDDGYIDEAHYEYECKFCPECGAMVKR